MWTLSGFIDEISPDFTEQCKVAAGLGLTYAEVRSAWEVNILDLDPDQLAAMKETLAAYDLRVSSIGSPIGKIFVDEEFAPHLERMRHAAEVAHFFDAPYIRIFSFFLRPGADPAAHRAEVIDRMRALVRVAEEADLILTPTTATTALLAEGKPPREIAGQPISGMGTVPFTAPFNISGMPAVSIPAGLSAEGMPVALQVVARRHEEELVLGCAAIAEANRPWPKFAPLAYS